MRSVMLIICNRMRLRSVRLQFVTACAVYAHNLLPHAQCTLTTCYRMRSTVYAYKAQNIWRFLSYTAHTLTICFRMRRVRLQFTTACALCRVRLQFATACTGYTYNLLPHAQGTLTIRYHMRRVRLRFATECLEYASKANHTLILPFQLNQVKTCEKSEKTKKLFLTHSCGPRQSETTYSVLTQNGTY